MLKNLRSIVLAICVLTVSGTLMAQDTCKSYNAPNPHGLAMTISKIWIIDSVNFSVESLQPLPYNIAATGTVDFKVCILSRDGVKRTTQVRYQNTHGTSSYAVTLTPPLSTVRQLPGKPQFLTYPNPANISVEIELGTERINNISLDIIDTQGKFFTSEFQHSGDKLLINTAILPPGTYTLVLKDQNDILGKSQIIIAR